MGTFGLGIRADRLFAIATLVLALPAFLAPVPAEAYEFEFGEVQGNFDTTVSIGASIRTEDPERSNFCTTLGGKSGNCGTSDGNLNYDRQWQLTSTAIKITHDLDLRWKNLGAFVRTSYFYDNENENGSRDHVSLTGDAKDVVGANIKLLDAYLSADFTPRDLPLSFKVGNQVISWGESTFIQNGINVINPVDGQWPPNLAYCCWTSRSPDLMSPSGFKSAKSSWRS